MTQITNIITIPTQGADYYQDQLALHTNSTDFAKRFRTKGKSPGFRSISEPSETLSVGLVMDNGRIAWGECAAPSFSTIAGRDPVFRSALAEETIQRVLEPVLVGKDIGQFRSILDDIERLQVNETQVRELPERQPGEKISRREWFKTATQIGSSSPHTERVTVQRSLQSAVLYGVSQAILQAAAIEKQVTITELICQEWDLPLPTRVIPILAQCGPDWYLGAEKMILRGIASLPHARIENIQEQIGKGALQLIKYSRWLKKRIQKLGSKDYQPVIHLDLQGSLGKVFDNDLGKILGVLSALESAVHPFALRIESPLVMATLQDQIQTNKQLRSTLNSGK